jgi:hypothetical protein
MFDGDIGRVLLCSVEGAVGVSGVSSVGVSVRSVSVRWSVISENDTWRAMENGAEVVVCSGVRSVPFARAASTGSRQGQCSLSLFLQNSPGARIDMKNI